MSLNRAGEADFVEVGLFYQIAARGPSPRRKIRRRDTFASFTGFPGTMDPVAGSAACKRWRGSPDGSNATRGDDLFNFAGFAADSPH
jgi:hypothetical protein